ncbi:hypothetical protein [Spiroplasma endosymbiont of Ammophila pubescens]|uniref:hypothetical protein n=1 Tax=Spiroplasma endosymbiont of Ammophila pubescens TaxID=3066315 RepID=UPI0032B25F78
MTTKVVNNLMKKDIYVIHDERVINAKRPYMSFCGQVKKRLCQELKKIISQYVN